MTESCGGCFKPLGAMEDEATGGVREQIILACIAVIEREGIEALTVRGVAQEARVNIAAINYYFRSKDRLLEEVLTRTRELGLDAQLRELAATIAAEGGDVRAGLGRFMPEFLRDATRYPRLTAAHFHDALARQDYAGASVRGFRAFIDEFFRLVQPALPAGTDELQRLRVTAFWSAIYVNLLMPRLFDGFVSRPIHEPPGAAAYARALLAQLFGEGGA